MTIGERIKLFRKEYHMTQMQLGEQIGLDGSNISRIERGLVIPNGNDICRMAKLFHVSCDTILGQEEVNKFGYIQEENEKIRIIGCVESERLKDIIRLIEEYQELSDGNKRELMGYLEMKLKYQK